MLSVVMVSLFVATNLGIIMRKALVSLLYRKLLRLSNRSLSEATSGRLISLSSGDMSVIQGLSSTLLLGVAGPFVAVFVFYITYTIVSDFLNLGWPCSLTLTCNRDRSCIPPDTNLYPYGQGDSSNREGKGCSSLTDEFYSSRY